MRCSSTLRFSSRLLWRLAGALGVPVVKVDCHSLFNRWPSWSARAVCSLPTPEYLGPIELSSLMSPPFTASIFQFSSYPLLSDSRIFVRHGGTDSSQPHNHLAGPISITSVGSPLFAPAGLLLRHSVHIQKTPHVSFPHAQVIRYLSFPLTPTIFIHSNPNLKSAVSSGRNSFTLSGCLSGGMAHRSCSRPPRHAPLLRHSRRFVDLYYILHPSSVFLSLGISRPTFPVVAFALTFFFYILPNGRHLPPHRFLR